MPQKVGKYASRNIALAQSRVSESVQATAIVHSPGFARRSVVYLVVVGVAIGLGGVGGGLVGAILALALVTALSALVRTVATRARPDQSSQDSPPHGLLALTGSSVYLFDAHQRLAWLRGGWSGWGPSGWQLGDEAKRWDRSTLGATATKDLVSWKVTLSPPNGQPYVCEAQAYGARGSNEDAITALIAGSVRPAPASA